jgi:hypothetical protein
MTVTFEPGDGSFDVIIETDEEVPREWADCPAAAIYRRVQGDR